MTENPARIRRLMIIDDDLLIREVLTLLAEDAGFDAAVFDSGESALESLAAPGAVCPEVILADMQLPGIAGDSLARLLRAACAPSTTLLAMSGTRVSPAQTASFDGFLLKPFSMDDVLAALTRAARPGVTPAPDSGTLNRSIFDSFQQSMPPEQLRKLYDLSLDDADARIEGMRKALQAGDAEAYRRAAHSIKGGCGMVGAVELANLASAMEEFGPQSVDDVGPLEQFLAASLRLRRMLDALYQ